MKYRHGEMPDVDDAARYLGVSQDGCFLPEVEQ